MTLLPIGDLEGYWISDDGRVFSDRIRRAAGFRKGSVAVIDPSKRHEVKPMKNVQTGYLQMRFTVKQKVTCRYVHRLVLEAFVGPCPNGMEARHLDGNKHNNSVSNLKWGTHRENQDDKVYHGTNIRGALHPNSKLNEDAVRIIRSARETGETWRSLADKFGVTTETIRSAYYGNTWAHVTEVTQ